MPTIFLFLLLLLPPQQQPFCWPPAGRRPFGISGKIQMSGRPFFSHMKHFFPYILHNCTKRLSSHSYLSFFFLGSIYGHVCLLMSWLNSLVHFNLRSQRWVNGCWVVFFLALILLPWWSWLVGWLAGFKWFSWSLESFSQIFLIQWKSFLNS